MPAIANLWRRQTSGILIGVLVSTVLFILLLNILFVTINKKPCQTLDVSILKDIGGIGQGDTTVYSVIELSNRGKERLVVNKIAPCCGTEILGNVPKYVESNSSVAVVLRVMVPLSNGPFTRSVLIETDNNFRPSTVVQLRGFFDATRVVSPEYVNLGYAASGLYLPDISYIRMSNIDKKYPYVVASSPLVMPTLSSCGDRKWAIGVRIAENYPPGQLHEKLLIKVGERQFANVDLTGIVDRGWLPEPRGAFLKFSPEVSIASCSIRLRRLSAKAKPPTVVSVQPKWVHAEIQLFDENTYEMNVNCERGDGGSQIEGFVEISNGMDNVFRVPLIIITQEENKFIHKTTIE